MVEVFKEELRMKPRLAKHPYYTHLLLGAGLYFYRAQYRHKAGDGHPSASGYQSVRSSASHPPQTAVSTGRADSGENRKPNAPPDNGMCRVWPMVSKGRDY